VYSSGISGDALNNYNFSENYRQGKYYYRIKMTGDHTGTKYSKIIAIDGLGRTANLVSIVNPFSNQLTAYVETPEAGIIKLQLIDNNGIVVQSQNTSLQQGTNRIIVGNTGGLAPGLYTLKLITNQNIISKKVIKQ
jgi:hypothetical protein